MAISLNLSEITYPFLCTHTIQPKAQCPLLGKTFTQLIGANRELSLPYVIALLSGPKANRYTVCDGHEWYYQNLVAARTFTNPETKKQADKVHFISLTTLRNGTSSSRLLGTVEPGKKTSEFLQHYISAAAKNQIPSCIELLEQHQNELHEVDLLQFSEMLLRQIPGHKSAIEALQKHIRAGKNDAEKLERARRVFGLANRLKSEPLYKAIAEPFLEGALSKEKVSFARGVLHKWLLLFPQNATVHLQLGIAYCISHEEALYKNGEKEFLRALELDPNLLGAHFALAKLYLTGGGSVAKNVTLAKEHFDVLFLAPDVKACWYFLGSKIHLEKEYYNPKLARWLLEEAKILEPKNESVLGAIEGLLKKIG